MTAQLPKGLECHTHDELVVAARHLEDLEIFAGQRSRMNPDPGWALVLDLLRRDLHGVRAELQQRLGDREI